MYKVIIEIKERLESLKQFSAMISKELFNYLEKQEWMNRNSFQDRKYEFQCQAMINIDQGSTMRQWPNNDHALTK